MRPRGLRLQLSVLHGGRELYFLLGLSVSCPLCHTQVLVPSLLRTSVSSPLASLPPVRCLRIKSKDCGARPAEVSDPRLPPPAPRPHCHAAVDAPLSLPSAPVS